MRELQVNVRMSRQEADRLEKLAAHYELTAGALIRMLLKREADALLRPPRSFAEAIAQRNSRDALAAETARSQERPDEHEPPADAKRVRPPRPRGK